MQGVFIADQGNHILFDTRDDEVNNCFVLVTRWLKHGPIALETATISSIGLSDRDSSHASPKYLAEAT